jgi:hypothetical protein
VGESEGEEGRESKDWEKIKDKNEDRFKIIKIKILVFYSKDRRCDS